MKNYLFGLAVLLFVASCTEKTEEAPSYVIPRNKMINLMVDLHIVEASISTKNLPYDSAELLYSKFEKEIFKKHHTTDSMYRKSFEYYSANPETFNKMYTVIVDSLTMKESRRAW